MKVYISGALASSVDLNKNVAFYEDLAQWLHSLEECPYLPHRTNHPVANSIRTDREVYNQDVNELLSSDVCLASLNEASFGVGAEVALALERGVIVIAYHHVDKQVSRFLSGMIEGQSEPNIIIRYENINELRSKIRDQVAKIQRSRVEMNLLGP